MDTPQKDFDTLIKDLHDSNEFTAYDAVKALSEVDDQRLIPHFLQELDYNTRQSGFDQYLEERRKSKVGSWMLGANDDSITEIRVRSAEGLYRLLGIETIPIFTKILAEDSNLELCCSVASRLRNHPSNEIVEALDQAITRAYDRNSGTNLVYLLRIAQHMNTPKTNEIVEYWLSRVGPIL